jgi:hypothetical protein
LIYQAAQVTTFATTSDHSATTSSGETSATDSVSSTTLYVSISDDLTSETIAPTQTPVFSTVGTSTSTTSSKSSADTLKRFSWLQSTLAMYTLIFTLFLIPVDAMSIFEFVLIVMTSLIGWGLLFLDVVVVFLRNPSAHTISILNQFKLGLLVYGYDRWNTFQLVRTNSHSSRSTKTFTRPRSKPAVPPRLGVWWKKDIIASLNQHNLHDYFNSPSFDLQKYPGTTAYSSPKTYAPTPLRTKLLRTHEIDDIFSSDEDLDTSPLAARTDVSVRRRGVHPKVFPKPVAVASGPVVNRLSPERDVSGASKETCVEDGLTPREKVAGFISWSALKRDERPPTFADERVDSVNASAVIERTDTDGSGSSWEREALGVGL